MKKVKKQINFLDTLLIAIVSSAISLFAMNLSVWLSFGNFFKISFANTLWVFTKPTNYSLWLLNVFLLLGVQMVLLLFTQRLFISQILFWFLTIVIMLAEFFKITDRNEPLLPADLLTASSFTSFLSIVPKSVTFLTIALILCVLIICFIIYKNDYQVFPKFADNYFAVAIIFVSIGSFLYRPVNFVDKAFYTLGDSTRYKFDATLDASTNGVPVSMANQIIRNAMAGNKYVHTWYNDYQIKKIVKQYQKEADKINQQRPNDSFKNQTVIYVLSESFTRKQNVTKLNLTDKFGNQVSTVTPNIDDILKNTPASGRMLSMGYGGGTANMEWMALSSMSYSFLTPQLETPFIQVVPKQNAFPAITDYFNNKIAIHDFLPTYYNRPAIYKKLGFKKFYSESDLSGLSKLGKMKYYSDESVYQNVINHLEDKNDRSSQFIELITMQNHTPYALNSLNHDYRVKNQEKRNDQLSQQTYLQGIHATDEATKTFLDELNQSERPVTVVFYGDHWPGVYGFETPTNGNMIYTHSTDYFIWQNEAAKNKNGTGKIKKDSIVGPNEFSPMMLQVNRMKVSPFYAFMTKVHEELPAVAQWNRNNNNLQFVKSWNTDKMALINQKKLTKKQKKLLYQYLLIQYDLVAGHQYSVKDNFCKIN